MSGGIHQVVSELASVSVGHGSDQPAAVVAGVELNLGNAGKILADDIAILFCIRAKFVKVHLLEEVGVFRWTLVALRIARVVETRAVSVPVDASARGGEVDARYSVGQLLAGGGLEDVA